MNRVLNSTFIGLVLFLILDTIFFAGIKKNYLDTLEIKEFFNPFFADNQCWLLWLLAPFLGYGILYTKFNKTMIFFYISLLLSVFLLFLPTIGYFFGELLFYQKDKKIELFKKSVIKTDVYYVGREFVYIKSLKGDGIIKIEKESIRFMDK